MNKPKKSTLYMIYFDPTPLKLMELCLSGYFSEKCSTGTPWKQNYLLQGISVDVFSQYIFLGGNWQVLQYFVYSSGMQKFFFLSPTGSIHVKK